MNSLEPKRTGVWQRWVRASLLVALVPALVLGVFVFDLVIHHNFHVVTPGVLYRSGQMSGGALAQAIREHGIKSVINLRGAAIGQEWYAAEVSTSAAFGVQHFDIPLSATRELKNAEMDEILATLDHAPKPVLIHCKSGSDRTGLVGALFLYGLEGQSAQSAGHQLAVLYGHLPHLFWGGTVAMDNSFWRYVSAHAQTIGSAESAGATPKQPASAPETSFAHNPVRQ
jgi:protein tyrosine phosphatase (PTP) superfamily phosphohydrolase (DUF442 family)